MFIVTDYAALNTKRSTDFEFGFDFSGIRPHIYYQLLVSLISVCPDLGLNCVQIRSSKDDKSRH